MAGFKDIETVEQALDKGAPIGAIAEYFGLSRAEVVECARRRQIEKRKQAEITKWRGAQACASEYTPPPWSEHEYALLQGLASIGKESAASRVLGRSPDDIRQAMKELDRRAVVLREEKRIAAENRASLYQRMKEEAIEANWLEIQAARRAPSREALQSIARKLKLTHVGNITINGKDYSRLLDQATAIVRARIEIVAAIGK